MLELQSCPTLKISETNALSYQLFDFFYQKKFVGAIVSPNHSFKKKLIQLKNILEKNIVHQNLLEMLKLQENMNHLLIYQWIHNFLTNVNNKKLKNNIKVLFPLLKRVLQKERVLENQKDINKISIFLKYLNVNFWKKD